jgi:hypothetical protein
MSFISLSINLEIEMEVKIMISNILMMCVVAGTALLGRSGDMFPRLREGRHVGSRRTSFRYGRSVGGFNSPLAPPVNI